MIAASHRATQGSKGAPLWVPLHGCSLAPFEVRGHFSVLPCLPLAPLQVRRHFRGTRHHVPRARCVGMGTGNGQGVTEGIFPTRLPDLIP